MSLDELLTIVIPVKNEEKNLALCLENVKSIKNVVVVDSGSTDSTCKIASDYGRTVVQFQWNGSFPKKRNWVLRNYAFTTPWVMFLDADERPDSNFWEEVLKVLPETTNDVFRVRLNNWFLGRFLKHGDVPRKTAIVRVGKAEYERIEESSWSNLDMEIHEHLVTGGAIGDIVTPIDHHDCRPLKDYIAKHNEYSSWEVGRSLNVLDRGRLTFRQRIKYSLMGCPLLPAFYFLYCYVFKFGFLDGKAGYYFSLLKFCQLCHIQAKLAEYRMSQAAKRRK